MILVMEQVFILRIRDAGELEDLAKEYMGSAASASVQAEIVALNWRAVQDKSDKTNALFLPIREGLRDIIRRGDASIQLDRFRLLIIGKSGCGKTTIMAKVCALPVDLWPDLTSYRYAAKKW
jgi:ABC-type sugar transport system ATPase subunit